MAPRPIFAASALQVILITLTRPVSALNSSSQAAPNRATQVAMPLYSGMGTVNFRVTTKFPGAQKYFDQGLAFVYGFNHDEAERSFVEAARIDPRLAMAYWGIALVLGPNYNLPGDEEYARQMDLQDALSRRSQVGWLTQRRWSARWGRDW